MCRGFSLTNTKTSTNNKAAKGIHHLDKKTSVFEIIDRNHTETSMKTNKCLKMKTRHWPIEHKDRGRKTASDMDFFRAQTNENRIQISSVVVSSKIDLN